MATEVKVFILLLLYFVGCDFVAYLILKIKMPYWKKIGYNMDILFAMGIFTIITGLKVFTFFAYELIFILTFIGIIMHYFIPELCNFIGYIFSIPLKKSYEKEKTEIILYEGHGYFAVLNFVSFKVMIYIFILLTGFNLIKGL